MKKIMFSLTMLVICLQACSDWEESIFDNTSYVMTRAIVDENRPSSSNPDLLADWEHLDIIVLNTERGTGEGYKVDAPWADGIDSNLAESFRKDIKKEDGWKMLFHTFKEVGFSKGLNYMCFYNQFTGFIKVFYYNEEAEKSQGGQWYVKTSEGAKTKMLDEATYLSKTASDPATNDMLIFSNLGDVPTTGIGRGWNGFEFQVSYATDLTSMDFKIGAYEKHVTDYDILGKAYLNSLGTITTTEESSTGISKMLANLAGPEAKKLIDKLGEGIFGDAVILGEKITDLISEIPGSSYVSAIKGGLDMLFGKTTTVSTSDIKLTTTGTIEMTGTGTSETTSVVPTLSFNLYDLLNPSTNSSNVNLVTNATSTSGHYLGVWTLEKNPVVYYNRLAMLEGMEKIGANVGGDKILVKADIPIPQIEHYDLDAIINPDLLPYIDNYSFSVKFIICDKLEGDLITGQDISSSFINSGNTLYSDSNLSLKEMPEEDKVCTMELSIDTDYWNSYNGYPYPYWFDWGKVVDGKLIAVVSLNMNCSYLGKTTSIYQSKIFDVDYGVDTTLLQPESAHHPPYSVVVNYGLPYTQTQFGWY